MVTRLPHRLDLEVLSLKYEDLSSWSRDNDDLLCELILEAGEYMVRSGENKVTLLELYLENEVEITIDMTSQDAGKTMRINEEHWVLVEDYIRASRARDAGEYIKKKADNGSDGHTSN